MAIGAIARAWDGRGPPTILTERVLAHYGYPSYETLLDALYTEVLPGRRIYEVAPLVFAAALDGDPIAQDLIVRTGAPRLAMWRARCCAVWRCSTSRARSSPAAASSRGSAPLLMDAANLALHRLAPLANFTRATVEPVVGALLLAFELHGQVPDDGQLARLHETLAGAADQPALTLRGCKAISPTDEGRRTKDEGGRARSFVIRPSSFVW